MLAQAYLNISLKITIQNVFIIVEIGNKRIDKNSENLCFRLSNVSSVGSRSADLDSSRFSICIRLITIDLLKV